MEDVPWFNGKGSSVAACITKIGRVEIIKELCDYGVFPWLNIIGNHERYKDSRYYVDDFLY